MDWWRTPDRTAADSGLAAGGPALPRGRPRPSCCGRTSEPASLRSERGFRRTGYRPGMSGELVRPSHGKIIAGVCAGIADRVGVSRSLVRLGFVLFGLFGVGELIYIVMWILMPKR